MIEHSKIAEMGWGINVQCVCLESNLGIQPHDLSTKQLAPCLK